MTRADTKHGSPARYLPKTTDPQIQEIEMTTVTSPEQSRNASAFKREYRRETGGVIGWDDGLDATISFVECSGGERAGRAFHGRPMNPTTLATKWPDQGDD